MFRVQGFGDEDLDLRVYICVSRAQGFRVWGFGFRVQGLGLLLRVLGFGSIAPILRCCSLGSGFGV